MFVTEKFGAGVAISKYTGTDPFVEVPEEINGLKVLKIGDEAFRGCAFLVEVILPKTVESIGNYGFCDCRKLDKIIIPPKVAEIGGHSFYNCRRLSSITMPNTINYIGDGFIKNCDEIKEITIDSYINISSGLSVFLVGIRQFFYLNIKEGNLRLVFTDYDFEYVTFAPAMKCLTVTHGAGEKYRQAIETSRINFETYDSCFIKAQMEEKEEAVLEIAITRLKSSFMLEEEFTNKYISYIANNLTSAIKYCAKKNDMSAVEMFRDKGIVAQNNIDVVVETAAICGNSEFSAFILDIKLSTFKTVEKNFDL